jgi:hemin uptake protein HemP
MSARRDGSRTEGASLPGAKAQDAVIVATSTREQRPAVDVRALLNGAREATLVLDGEAYRLRITAKEKLILTK